MNTIFHLDMDAFFAQVEVLDHPEWKGKPLVVGSPPTKRGVVATASYEARRYGIHSAMPSRTAGKLCPHAVFTPPRMARYAELSEQIMELLHDVTPMIEQISVDEAFMDVRGVLRSSGTPEQLGRAIKKRIKDETGLTGSLGIARNKFLAKLGSDYRKPDGLTVIPESDDEVKSFLAPLPVSRIWGVGKVMNQRLAEAGIRTIADVQALPVSALIPIAGAVMAEHIHHLAFGIDHRPIVTESEAKSISAECTFDHDVSDPGHLRSSLVDLVEQVGRRLRRSGKTARTVHLKLRYDDFETITRQQTLRQPSRSDRRLIEAAAGLFARQSFERPVRLIGFGVSGFDGEESGSLQGELFAASDPGDARDARLDEAVDRIRETFGRHAVRRGGRIET